MKPSPVTVFSFEADSNAQQPLETAQALLAAVASSKIAVIYLPPWALEGLLTEERLQAWFDFHLKALVLRGKFSERVTFGRARTLLAKRDVEFRAALFERAWPEWWDLYESLESVADLNGEEPAFRQSGSQIARADLLSVFNAITRIPLAEAEIKALRQQAKETVSERDIALGKLKAEHETALNNLKKSKEAVQRQALDASKDAQKQLDAAQAAAEQSAATVKELERRAKGAEADSELLLLQLHQVQEELERQFLNSNALETEVKLAAGVLRDVRSILALQLRA